MTQKTGAVFLAPDDADAAEGIAGMTWVRDGGVRVNNLPDLRTNPTPEKSSDYAARAFVTEDWVRSRIRSKLPCPRALCGIPVRVGGKLWGVIVLDSRQPDTIKTGSFYNAQVEMMSFYLAELLKRV